MADLPSDFWGGWIAVITIVSLAGLTWALFSIYFSPGGDEEQKSLVWDGSLKEGTNAPPLWWFWLVFASLVLTVIYLMLYPGLGSYSGALRWSQAGHMSGSNALYEETFGNLRMNIAETPIDVLQRDAMAMESAERIFQNNCAACHGADAQGQANLFPDLTDSEWQWGGEAEQIEQTIRNGRMAIMSPHREIVGDAGVRQVTDYVLALSRDEPVAEGNSGRMIFETYCFVCHGLTGTGNPLLGAPDLTNRIWLYGGGSRDITEAVANGRNGVMPAFGDRLDDTRIRLLVAWISGNASE